MTVAKASTGVKDLRSIAKQALDGKLAASPALYTTKRTTGKGYLGYSRSGYARKGAGFVDARFKRQAPKRATSSSTLKYSGLSGKSPTYGGYTGSYGHRSYA